MLSRTEDLKCTLMKVGEKYGLPLDLMKQVYRFKLESEEEDRERDTDKIKQSVTQGSGKIHENL